MNFLSRITRVTCGNLDNFPALFLLDSLEKKELLWKK